MKKGFGSDNHAGAHPLILQSIVDCNQFHEPSYGTDPYSALAVEEFRKLFGHHVDVHFVYNGTAANILSLQAMVRSYQSTLCSDISHLNVDECGAPEFFAGKLQTIPHINGKILPKEIEKYIIRKGDQHFSQIKAISLTQPTELGTCYTLQEMKEITDIAKKHQFYVHIDGARLSNAVYWLKTSFKEMVTELGVDILSFGGTKNGFLFGEAVVILNKNLQKDFKYIRKQSAQLPSKTRYIANQFLYYLRNDTYLNIAKASCSAAEILYSKLQNLSLKYPEVKITQPQESNAVFVILPKEIIKPLREKCFFYVWNEHTMECRLMTSWDTQLEDIHLFISELESLLIK